MAELYAELEELPTYYDRRTCTSLEDWREAVRTSRVVYVGNLNYFTTEEELYEVRSRSCSMIEANLGPKDVFLLYFLHFTTENLRFL